MISRHVILVEEMNPRYCAARGCRSPIGLHQKSAEAGYHSLPGEVPDGCLCMREVE
jgi:hypothetical protein